MGKTYTKSETVRMLGVSRAKLERYENLKLLQPTVKKNHTCLYDDKAIIKLMIIEIFRQAGYKRLEIKDLLENREQLVKEYDVAIEKT